MHALHSALDRLRPIAPLLLRLGIGFVFVWHGIDKFRVGIDMVEGAFSGWGVPAPGLAAPFTAIVEIAAGAALLLGLGTRIAALLLALIMVGSLIFVKSEMGMPEADPDIALLVGSLALAAYGGGAISADRMLGLESS